MHHSIASATAVKILGTKHSPNGNIPSQKHSPRHQIPRSGCSSRCTGISRYADSTSIFAIRAPMPSGATPSATMSTDTYLSEQRGGSIPSLISTTSHHAIPPFAWAAHDRMLQATIQAHMDVFAPLESALFLVKLSADLLPWQWLSRGWRAQIPLHGGEWPAHERVAT